MSTTTIRYIQYSYDEFHKDADKLLYHTANNPNAYGASCLYYALSSTDFSYDDQLKIIVGLNNINQYKYFKTLPYRYESELKWEDRVYREMDKWYYAWVTAIQDGIPYKGFSNELSSLYGIVRD